MFVGMCRELMGMASALDALKPIFRVKYQPDEVFVGCNTTSQSKSRITDLVIPYLKHLYTQADSRGPAGAHRHGKCQSPSNAQPLVHLLLSQLTGRLWQGKTAPARLVPPSPPCTASQIHSRCCCRIISTQIQRRGTQNPQQPSTPQNQQQQVSKTSREQQQEQVSECRRGFCACVCGARSGQWSTGTARSRRWRLFWRGLKGTTISVCLGPCARGCTSVCARWCDALATCLLMGLKYCMFCNVTFFESRRKCARWCDALALLPSADHAV
jgi:hypothetical protein